MTVMMDVLKSVKSMKAAGFTEAQIEAMSEMFQGTTATKMDVMTLGADLRLEMKVMESSIRSDMKEMDNKIDFVRVEVEKVRGEMKESFHKLTISMGGMITGAIIAIAALQKIL